MTSYLPWRLARAAVATSDWPTARTQAKSNQLDTYASRGGADKGFGRMADGYDAIILGAGHNGLILQAYLARAGLKTLSIERKAVAGGGLSTMDDPRHPGFLHNTHAFFQRGITAMPWFTDLDLARHGIEVIEPDLNVLLITSDGRTLEWWTDFERTVASFAAFNKRDAATLRRWHDAFVPIVRNILRAEASSPPLPPADGARSSNAPPTAACCLKPAPCRRSTSSGANSRTRPSRPAFCSSTACARSICACPASAITSPPCSPRPGRRRCRRAARPRLPARSKAPCARPAARSA